MFKFGNLTYDVISENKLVSDVHLNDIVFEKMYYHEEPRVYKVRYIDREYRFGGTDIIMTMFILEDIQSGKEFKYCALPIDRVKVLRIIRFDPITWEEAKHC